MCTSVARHIAISSNARSVGILGAMQQRTTLEPANDPERGSGKPRPPFVQRLWRNQLGIMLAVALTLAAVGILILSRQG